MLYISLHNRSSEVIFTYSYLFLLCTCRIMPPPEPSSPPLHSVLKLPSLHHPRIVTVLFHYRLLYQYHPSYQYHPFRYTALCVSVAVFCLSTVDTIHLIKASSLQKAISSNCFPNRTFCGTVLRVKTVFLQHPRQINRSTSSCDHSNK